MKILFLGGIFPEIIENEIYKNSLSGIQVAADKLQKLILKGFKENKKIEVKILNNIFVGAYPKHYKTSRIKFFKFSYEGIEGQNLGFYNYFGFKHINRFLNVLLNLFKETKEKKIIFIYSMHTPFILSSIIYKFFNKKNVKIYLMIPDLPDFMNTTLKKETLLKKVDKKLSYWLIKYIDKFILLTDKMSVKLQIKKKDFIVIEGMTEFEQKYYKKNMKIKEKKIILYTGTLNKRYGVIDLIEAFKYLKNSNYELWLCGKGDSEATVQIEMINDSRIKYLGQMKHEEILKLQKKVTLLVNPRPNNEEFTKYSFPSKIMEYLNSGTPVLIKKLDGIPSEYYNYCFSLGEVSNYEFSEKIKQILEKDSKELEEIGEKAYKFIQYHKNNISQVQKIIEFIKKDY